MPIHKKIKYLQRNQLVKGFSMKSIEFKSITTESFYVIQ